MHEPAPRVVERATGLRSAVRRYVARRVAPESVDDVVQDVFVRLAGNDAEPRKLEAWVYAVARSAVAAHHRRAARPEPEVDPEPSIADDGIRAAIAGWLGAQIPLLPEPYAATLTMTELEGRSHALAATELGVARGTIKARVSRGRALLRGRLEACCRIEVDARDRVIGWEPRGVCCG